MRPIWHRKASISDSGVLTGVIVDQPIDMITDTGASCDIFLLSFATRLLERRELFEPCRRTHPNGTAPVISRQSAAQVIALRQRFSVLRLGLLCLTNRKQSDNERPFRSKAWSDFLRSCGVHHRRITPLRPVSSPHTSRKLHLIIIQPMKAVRQANVWCRNCRREVYHDALHTVQNCSRVNCLRFGWESRTKLPVFGKTISFPDDQNVRNQNAIAKNRMQTCWHMMRSNAGETTEVE